MFAHDEHRRTSKEIFAETECKQTCEEEDGHQQEHTVVSGWRPDNEGVGKEPNSW